MRNHTVTDVNPATAPDARPASPRASGPPKTPNWITTMARRAPRLTQGTYVRALELVPENSRQAARNRNTRPRVHVYAAYGNFIRGSIAAILSSVAVVAQANRSGEWMVTVHDPFVPSVARSSLSVAGETVTGSFGGRRLEGSVRGAALEAWSAGWSVPIH